MNDVTLAHPSIEQLTAFGLGRLDRSQRQEVERHVADCDACRLVLEGLPDDSLVLCLRGSPAAAPAASAATRSCEPAAAVSGEVPPGLRDHPRYRVEGLLGLGGMGAVFEAEHLLMKRPVALKVISTHLLSHPAAVERFRREVQAAGQLTHPHIVHAYDAEQVGDTHFLVMEYVEGISLARLVTERGPLPVAEACAYVRQAALGLQHAHERGMVHRDIKPQNLMVTRAGIKILDFGLARFALESAPPLAQADTAHEAATQMGDSAPAELLTQVGTVVGTPDYIAPEQARDAHSADIRADIYSLGCTLYDLLTGKPPFPEGTAMQKVIGQLERTPRPLTELRPEVLPELARIVEKMMAKDPARRYQTPAEVAEVLLPWADPVPADAKGAHNPPGPRYSALTRSRRRVLVAVSLLFAALLLAAVVVIRIQTDRGEIVVQTDDKSLELTVRKNGEIIRIRDPQSDQTWDVDTKRYQIAVADRPDGLTIDLAGRDSITLRRRDGKTVTVTTAPKGPPQARVPTAEELAQRPNAADALKHEDVPELARAYFGDGNPTKAPPELVGVLGTPAFRCPQGAGRPTFSPDGKLLVVPQPSGIVVFDARDGRPLRVLNSKKSYAETKAVFSPDGRALVLFGPKQEQYEVIDAITGGVVFDRRLTFLAASIVWKAGLGSKRGDVSDLAFSPDGTWAAVAYEDGEVNLIDWQKAPQQRQVLQTKGTHVTFSRDGTYLAVGTESLERDDNVHVVTADGKKLLHTLFAPGVAGLAFEDEGGCLVGISSGVIRRWEPATGKELAPVTIPELKIAGAMYAYSPASSILAVTLGEGDRVVRVFDAKTGKPLVPEAGHGSALTAMAWSPDGQKLATADEHGKLILWDVAKQKPVGRLGRSGNRVSQIVFSADGRWVTTLESWRSDKSHSLVTLWDSRDLRMCGTLGLRAGQVVSKIALSPDGSVIATANGDETVSLWKRGPRQGDSFPWWEQFILPHGDRRKDPAPVQVLAFSPSGEELMTVTAESLRLWKVKDGKEADRYWEAARTTEHIEWLSNGREVGLLSRLGDLENGQWLEYEVWNRRSGEFRTVVEGPKVRAPIIVHDVGPAFRLVAYTYPERKLVLWRPDAQNDRRRFFDMVPSVATAVFSPDGRYLAVGDKAGVVSLLRLAERGKVPELPSPDKVSEARRPE